MKNIRIAIMPAICCLLFFTACKKDQLEEANEEELITTLKLTFVPVGGGSTLTYQFDDADGPGGLAAVQDEIRLAASTTYNVTAQLLNKTTVPEQDITEEVAEEPLAHRLYYVPAARSNITVSGFDNDPNGVPLAITSVWTTGAVATGKMEVTLRHYAGTPPGKEATDPADSGKSSTDIAVIFDTRIQ